MTDTKLLRHSLDSAAPLKPQKRWPLGVQGSGYATRYPPPAAPRPHRLTAPKLLTPTWLSSWLNPGCLERREKSGDAEEVGFSESQSRCRPLSLSTCSSR